MSQAASSNSSDKQHYSDGTLHPQTMTMLQFSYACLDGLLCNFDEQTPFSESFDEFTVTQLRQLRHDAFPLAIGTQTSNLTHQNCHALAALYDIGRKALAAHIQTPAFARKYYRMADNIGIPPASLITHH